MLVEVIAFTCAHRGKKNTSVPALNGGVLYCRFCKCISEKDLKSDNGWGPVHHRPGEDCKECRNL